MATRFGLGSPMGIELPGEKGGLIPTKEWKRAVTGVPWQQGETLVAAIGQGFVLSTPLQLAVMTARMANGGRSVTPKLVKTPEPVEQEDKADKKKEEKKAVKRIGISRASLNVVLDGMFSVTNTRKGTAYHARIKEEGMEMSGKTGTSQVKRISKRERDTRVLKNHERPWKDRDHALFVGYAPVKKPRFAVAVVVEHGGGGSKTAAPIARDLLLEIQRKDRAVRTGKKLAGAQKRSGKT